MKNVIITGTSRGIGYELAQIFAKNGYQVLALSRNNEAIKNLNLDTLQSFPFDITQEKDIEIVVEFVKNNWNQVDILINNAGFLISKPFEELTKNDFLEVYDINVFGVALLTQKMIPFMAKNSHVVTISSMGGIQGSSKFAGLAAYSSAKGAVITLSELLAEEYKNHPIAFNVLAIGAVQTEMLAEAFPGYKAPLTAQEMATYIFDFATTGQKFYNGKVLQVSVSTP